MTVRVLFALFSDLDTMKKEIAALQDQVNELVNPKPSSIGSDGFKRNTSNSAILGIFGTE